MTVRALYTLGNSDLQLIDSEGNVFSRPLNLREITKTLLEHIKDNPTTVDHKNSQIILDKEIEIKYKAFEGTKDLLIERVNLPMLCPFLNKIIELSEKKLKKFELILFATNQNNPKYNDKDTLYLAELIKEALLLEWRYHIKDVKIEEINVNPTDYSEMEIFFGDYIKNNDVINLKHNYVQITAGTPAMCFNLALNIVDFHHTIIYLKPKGETKSEAFELDYFTKMHYKKYLSILKKSLEGFSFQIAKEIIQESPFKKSHEVDILLDILIRLCNFDFDEAHKLSERIPTNIEVVELIRKIKLNTEKFSYKIAYDLIEKYHNKNQYIETTALLAGLYDNLRQFLFCRYTGCLVKDKKGSFNSFNEYIESNEELKEKLKNNDLSNYKDNPSKPVLSTILSWLESKNTLTKEQEQVLGDFTKLNKEMKVVQDIRNDTMYGHGMSGISQKQYESKIKNIVTETKDLVVEKIFDFEKEDKENVFDKINNIIINNLVANYL